MKQYLLLFMLITSILSASGDILDNYGFQLKKVGEGIDYIYRDYLDKKVIEADYQLQKRFNDGYVLFTLQDYIRAAMIFYDIVSKKDYKNEPTYVEALFYLAESYKFLKNYLGAQEYYKQVLEHHSKQYDQNALEQLLEISYKIGDYRDIDLYVKRLKRETKTIRPEIFYARGKSAYFEKRYDVAINSFNTLLRRRKFKLKALYFIGVCYTAQKKYDKAIEAFKTVSQMTPVGSKEAQVVDLAILSIGRLYYTLKNIPQAIDAYQNLKRNSKYYDLSLYETAWSFIQAKSEKVYNGPLKKALYAVELLIDVLPNSKIIPEAMLLRGNLYNEMNKSTEAFTAYNNILDRYGKITNQLNRIIEHNEDLEGYFAQLLGSDLGSFSAAKFLPQEALKYVQSEKSVLRAKKIVAELEKTRGFLTDSMVILKKLLQTLSDKKSINALFPKTDDIRAQSLEYDNKLIEIEYQLVDYVYQKTEGTAKGKKWRNDLLKIYLKRKQLWDVFKSVPLSKEGYKTRKKRIIGEYVALEKRAYTLKMRIKEMKKQVLAMERLFSENSARYKYSESKKQLFYEHIGQKKKGISLLDKRLDAQSKEIQGYKGNINLMDTANLADSKLKERLIKLLQEERDLYRKYSDRHLRKFDHLFRSIRSDRKRLAGFSSNLDNMIFAKAMELKKEIQKEELKLKGFNDQLIRKIRISKKLSAKIALFSFQSVSDMFHSLILSADVGIIEVSWKQKTGLSKQIIDLYSEKSNRTKILQNEFREILGESQ